MRSAWQPEVVPWKGELGERAMSQIAQVEEIYGLPLVWSPMALAPGEWPDEGAEGTIDAFMEATRADADYLVADRELWSGFPDPPQFSIWRMKKDETDWRFLGHFDKWPANWVKQGQ